MPALAKFSKKLPDNVKVMTYCLNAGEDMKYAKKVLADAGFDGDTLISGDGDLKKFDQQVLYTPTTVFVDSNGNIVGEAIIGANEDLEAVYTEHINAALESIGKQGI